MNSERLLEIQTLLLTQTALRRVYRDDAYAALRPLGVNEDTMRELPAWDADELDAQARTLLDKRWHEVRQLLFGTLTDGGEQYREVFNDYADGFWPEGHQRHVKDAVSFADHLAKRGERRGRSWRANFLRFRLGTGWFRLHWVNTLPVRSRCGCGFQLLYRRSSGPSQLLLYLAV
jgi:hypothetical protein